MKLLQHTKFINALPPVADAYSNTATDVINMKGFNTCTFIVQEGVGTAGTATLTVEACDVSSCRHECGGPRAGDV